MCGVRTGAEWQTGGAHRDGVLRALGDRPNEAIDAGRAVLQRRHGHRRGYRGGPRPAPRTRPAHRAP